MIGILSAIGIFILAILLIMFLSAPGAWLLMVLAGALGHELGLHGLFISFKAAYLIVLFISFFISGLGASK